MTYVKWTFLAIIAVLVFSFLHYTLPQHDVVRITNTDIRRVDFGDNAMFWSGSAPGNKEGVSSRDVLFIEAFYEDGKPIVYRNQDTGWLWPPYFKVNSSNLQAEAQDIASTKDNPQWVVVTHYGWRSEYLSIYPNAIDLRQVDSPDVRIVPWFNIVFLTVLALVVLTIRNRWVRFRETRIEPMIDEAGDIIEAVDDKAEGLWRRLSGSRKR
ncbi:uncharacterized protein DUF1523 [Rhodovulum imhoffii]|uniref:Uncharacterized protein DUF1523 n=1 Tax=Rhodovulum imhoffii TaxID=365340 RepID=A0A2T5BS09_9RHOB|nr:DUF1523 family protein [Rhodovulum imhoffii]MBK5933157.1 hypothetical protein [Rhodovulum imhoffii]PTN02097.1 uncharacterized protein DUF1523 [Rhodovulum imhoffii]